MIFLLAQIHHLTRIISWQIPIGPLPVPLCSTGQRRDPLVTIRYCFSALSITIRDASIERLLLEALASVMMRRSLQIILIVAILMSATGIHSVCASAMMSQYATCCCSAEMATRIISQAVPQPSSLDCIPACCSSRPVEKGIPLGNGISTQQLSSVASETVATEAGYVVRPPLPAPVNSCGRQGPSPPLFILCHSMLI